MSWGHLHRGKRIRRQVWPGVPPAVPRQQVCWAQNKFSSKSTLPAGKLSLEPTVADLLSSIPLAHSMTQGLTIIWALQDQVACSLSISIFSTGHRDAAWADGMEEVLAAGANSLAPFQSTVRPQASCRAPPSPGVLGPGSEVAWVSPVLVTQAAQAALPGTTTPAESSSFLPTSPRPRPGTCIPNSGMLCQALLTY